MQTTSWAVFIGVVLLVHAAATWSATTREMRAIKTLYSKKRDKNHKNMASSVSSSMGMVPNDQGPHNWSGGEYVPEMGPWLSDQSEPSCEQLRQMWRQSKRHSRAAETTNEIPQYSDPFARASLDAYAAQMLRPRPERRPVVYGRVQQSPTDKSLRPFDVLRRLNGRPMMKSDTSDTDDAAVLFGEEDISPFAKAPAKGSLQNLRDFVREEQGSLTASKGGFQNLRELIREEKLQGDTKAEWADEDVGRVVTSPVEHKVALYGMQSDAPYEMPQSSRRLNRLQMFRGANSVGKSDGRHRAGASHSKMRESRDRIDGLLLQLRTQEARKPFPRADPRGRKGSQHSSSLRNSRQMDIEDAGDVYVQNDRQHRQDRQPFYVSSKFRRHNVLQSVN